MRRGGGGCRAKERGLGERVGRRGKGATGGRRVGGEKAQQVEFQTPTEQQRVSAHPRAAPSHFALSAQAIDWDDLMTERASDSAIFEVIVDRDEVQLQNGCLLCSDARAQRKSFDKSPLVPFAHLLPYPGLQEDQATELQIGSNRPTDSRFPPSLPHHPPPDSFVSRGSPRSHAVQHLVLAARPASSGAQLCPPREPSFVAHPPPAGPPRPAGLGRLLQRLLPARTCLSSTCLLSSPSSVARSRGTRPDHLRCFLLSQFWPKDPSLPPVIFHYFPWIGSAVGESSIFQGLLVKAPVPDDELSLFSRFSVRHGPLQVLL